MVEKYRVSIDLGNILCRSLSDCFNMFETILAVEGGSYLVLSCSTINIRQLDFSFIVSKVLLETDGRATHHSPIGRPRDIFIIGKDQPCNSQF